MKNTIYLILGLFITSCGGNLDKAEKQDLSAQDEGAIHEGQAVDQSKYTSESYLIKGSEIATQTQKELLRAVQGAMAEGGPAYAVDYCNLEALEIKDSLSELNNCTIQRLSFKYRNPADKPATDLEKQQLKSFERLHEGIRIADHIFDYIATFNIRWIISIKLKTIPANNPGIPIAKILNFNAIDSFI
jgi:hypothetical protein